MRRTKQLSLDSFCVVKRGESSSSSMTTNSQTGVSSTQNKLEKSISPTLHTSPTTHDVSLSKTSRVVENNKDELGENKPRENTVQIQRKHVDTKEIKPLIVFTDGACIHNGKPNAKAAYACVWVDYPQYNIGIPISSHEAQTNNRAEYRAFLHAMAQADQLDESKTQELHVYTDSQLMIDSCTKWLQGWKRKGWKKSDGSPVANVDLLSMIDDKMKHRRVKFTHVRAHTGKNDWQSLHNDMVDRLARSAIC